MNNAGSGDIRPENREGGHSDRSSMENFTPLPSDKVLKMTVGPEAWSKHWNGVNSPIGGGWTPFDSLLPTAEVETSAIASHGRIDNSSYTAILQSQGTNSTTNVVHFQSDCSLVELEPTIPCFGSGSFSEMDSFFTRQSCHQIASLGCSADYSQQGCGSETAKVLNLRIKADNFAQIHEECKIFDEATMTPSSDGKKRKRDDSAQLKNMKTDGEKDQCPGKHDERKWKPERKPAANIFRRLEGKQVKDNSIAGDAAKEDWVHVRAKRGHATNSHSLAERVRREKIRDRMKFLQDLVPGCSKITGKAVMLDEIINYVLSLQRQVEFLSMKLSTVYPEMNVDPEKILSRDIHHSQGGNAAIQGDPGMSNYPKELLQGAYLTTQTSNLEPSIIPNVACIWDGELNNIGLMDFISKLAPQNQDSNGVLK